MITTSPYSSAVCSQFPQAAPVKQTPLFAGKKEAKDTDSFKKHGSHSTSAHVNPAFLQKLLLTALLLGGAAAAPGSKSGKGVAVRDSQPGTDVFSPQFNKTLDSLVPGLTNDQAVEMLKRPPFKPTDNDMFSHAVYDNIAALPAAKRTISDDEVKNKQKDTFIARFGKDDPRVAEGMALFDDPQLKALIPDVRLRGAVINLSGTLMEPSLKDAYQAGKFLSMKFEDLPPNIIAHVTKLSNETLPRVEVNGRYQFEDFRLLTPPVGHEGGMHQDTELSRREELTADSLDSLVHGQIVLENPDLLKDKTELTQLQCTKAEVRVNSRDAGGKLRLSTAQGNVIPGAKKPLAFFADNYDTTYDNGFQDVNGTLYGPTSPGTGALRSILKKLTGQSHDSANFDQDTVDLIDQNETTLSPAAVIALAKILKLDTGDIPAGKPTTSSSVEPTTLTTATSATKPTSSTSSSALPTHTFSSDAKRRHKLFGFEMS